MSKTIKRVYIDSSAIGGKFNKRVAKQTKPFWDAVERGEIIVLVSDMLEREVMDEKTPQCVKDFFDTLLEFRAVRLTAGKEANDLARRYIEKKVVDKSSFADCLHIAYATVAHADALVSWNLKHMVDRCDEYKSVNDALSYPKIEIITPEKFMEVSHDKK